MIIEFDYDVTEKGEIIAVHFIETEPGKYPQFAHAALGPHPVDVIHHIAARHRGQIPMQGSGWEVPSKHPAYPGKTRHEVLINEIVRNNDTASMRVLGISPLTKPSE